MPAGIANKVEKLNQHFWRKIRKREECGGGFRFLYCGWSELMKEDEKSGFVSDFLLSRISFHASKQQYFQQT
jgi:hypothetical protein